MYNGWNNEHPGGQQVSNVSPKVFMLLHATVMTRIRYIDDDRPFIVLTETKFSSRCIPVWIGTLLAGLGSKKNTSDNVLTMPSKVPW